MNFPSIKLNTKNEERKKLLSIGIIPNESHSHSACVS